MHSRSNFISAIQTKPPLVKSSKFLLSRQYEQSIQPLIGWDSWDTQDINSEFPLLESDVYNSITLSENSNITESGKDSLSKILPSSIETNPINGTSKVQKIKGKSKSKKTNKSQKPPVKKSKSRTKKLLTSSVAKNIEQFVEENNITVNLNENSFLESDEPLSIDANSETPRLQLDISSDNTTNQSDYVSNITPSIAASTSPTVEDKSTVVRNIATNNLQFNSELPSSDYSTDLSTTERIMPSQEKIEIDSNVSELVEDSPVEFSSDNNVAETFYPSSNFANNQQEIITETSELANISDVPVKKTSKKQDIKKHQIQKEFDDKSSTNQINLIQAKEVSPILNSPSPEDELPNANSNFDAIPVIKSDLILESTANDFVTNNAVADNSLTLTDVDDTPKLLHPLDTEDNIIGPYITTSNSGSSVTKNPIPVEQEIDSDLSHYVEKPTKNLTPKSPLLPENGESLKPLFFQEQGFLDPMKNQEIDSGFTSESPDSTLVQLTPTLANIENTPSLFSNSDSDEQLVTLESQAAMGVNVLDISANVSSVQRDSNFENTTSEFTESHSILAAPEITETPIITATSPEISEALVVSTTSPEIAETPTITAISPEIDEIPTITAISPEIAETSVVSASSIEIDEIPTITATSPEISEALVVSASSPEIDETPTITAISPEIVETPTITATFPEIIEALVVSASSPEIDETPTITAISPEIVEETSVFRKIIDKEQTGESENPEISTFADTWDNPDILENPTSLQDEVSTAPKVEQNAIAPKGYATGGYVTDSQVENRQQIAPSDIVPAILTPGEFVINTRDAQKNLPLLHHINTGGTPQDIILPSLQTSNPTEPEETISRETPTKVDSFSDTSLQLKSIETDSPQIFNSLIPSSLGLNISKQKLSILNSPHHTLQNETIDVGESSPQYSSPPLIFRKANSTTNTSSQWSNTPSQWSSVEDLLNGNNDDFTSFNFNDGESNSQNYEFPHVSESPQVFAKHLPSPRGFVDGGEVTLPDISREIQPVTETIDNKSLSSAEDNKDDTANLEALAREIYNRLRQRIEIERERHGGYSGRLPW
ncbi:MAG: hypothetical protein HWQ35_27530 [Nostoc sp. NMS1]|nr:hypothetical protein [Nostoc sp. NMS1]